MVRNSPLFCYCSKGRFRFRLTLRVHKRKKANELLYEPRKGYSRKSIVLKKYDFFFEWHRKGCVFAEREKCLCVSIKKYRKGWSKTEHDLCMWFFFIEILTFSRWKYMNFYLCMYIFNIFSYPNVIYFLKMPSFKNRAYWTLSLNVIPEMLRIVHFILQ